MLGSDLSTILYTLSVAVIPVLFAITVHEVAHGWVARRFGDPTAHLAGRLTLNPIKHIDPIGTIIVPGVMLFMTGFIFGWAKPVPVAFQNLRNPRRDMILVAAAGPGVNFLMALMWAVIAAAELTLFQIGGTVGLWILAMCRLGIFVNVLLAIFNMIPIPPLDGGRVLAGLLPPDGARVLDRIEPFGILIVLVLLFTVLWDYLQPIIDSVYSFFSAIAGLP